MKHRRDDGGINGFTMIEILIVIVVLGMNRDGKPGE